MTRVIRESGPPYDASSVRLYEVVHRIALRDLERASYPQGPTCRLCGHEIHGTMYVCTQCPHFELCAQCEQEDRHAKSHLLYKVDVRIPPHLRAIALKGDMPAWTSDDNMRVHEVDGAVAARLDYDDLERLKRGLDDVLGDAVAGITSAEIDALYEQFKCLLDTPHAGAFGAVSRDAFRSMLLTRYCVDDVLFDFLFGVYDSDGDGVVSFADYIRGISVIIHGTPAAKAKFLAAFIGGGGGGAVTTAAVAVDTADAKDRLRRLLLSYVDMSKNIFADAANLQSMGVARSGRLFRGRGRERRRPRREELSMAAFQSDLLWDDRDEIDTWAAYQPLPSQPVPAAEISMLWDLSIEELVRDIFSQVGSSPRALEHVLATDTKIAAIVTSIFDAGII